MADNKLGEDVESTREVCRMLTENCILRKLNLSGNGFSDKDIDMLISALEVSLQKKILFIFDRNIHMFYILEKSTS